MQALSSPAALTMPHPGTRSAQPLLPLKFMPPPTRELVQLRPDLQALLAEVRLQPVTMVVAPAGYGKTTLLSHWENELSRTGAPVCWLTVDSAERDPAMFLAYLIGAFQKTFPGLGADAWRMLQSVAHVEFDWPLVAGALCSDLQRKLVTASFLVLDDLHTAADSAVVAQILGYILRAAPPTLHVILATRRMLAFAPIGRLRTERRIVELTQRDLHLSVDEARQVLAGQQVNLEPDELNLLLARTDGWALSLQLAARALADLPAVRRGSFVRALGGGQEQIFSYLATEVLADLPPDLMSFLQMAAIPAYFDADLLTAVLDRDDVGYLLRRAQVLGLPIIALEAHSDLVRFHPLWRELLLRGLSEQIDGDQLRDLQRQFGMAFETRGELEQALEHFAQADAEDDLARALRDRAWPLLQSPRRETIRSWLTRLPESLRDQSADLLYMWGFSHVVSDPAAAAAAIVRAAAMFREADQPARELRAYSDLVPLFYWQTHPAEFTALCASAIRAANRARDSWSRGTALTCVAAMLASRGRYSAALRVAQHAATRPLNPAWRWLLAIVRATINTQLGRPVEAIAIIDETLALPLVDQDDRLRQHLLRQRAMARLAQGAIDEAVRVSLEAHRALADYYRDGTAGHSAAQLGLLLAINERPDEAITYLTQARTLFHESGMSAELASVQLIELYAMAKSGRSAAVGNAIETALRAFDSSQTPHHDLRLRLLVALTFESIGETARALDVARQTVEAMERHGYRLYLATASLYVAALALRSGDQPLHADMLQRGWELAAAERADVLPLLPIDSLRAVAVAGLRAGIEVGMIAQLLPRQDPEHVVALLEALLGDDEPAVRTRAARILGGLGAASSYPALRVLLKDRSTQVRQAAEDALSRLVYRPSYGLKIRTLGAFSIWRGEIEVRDRDWRSSKARQLFQLLLTERGRMLSRDRVLETLWPDLEADAAANNLRVTINRLSKALEPDRPDGAPPTYLVSQAETYGFNMACEYELDAANFAAAVTEGQRADERGQRQIALLAFRRAIDLYGGQFLPDNLYEDWSVVERERLALLFNETAIRLGSLLLEEGHAHEAIGLAWRVLEQDRAQEDAYLLLMRAHASLGERSTALRLYARCVTALNDELGVTPMPATTTFYEQLRER